MLKTDGAEPSFKAIKTFLPSGVLKATLYKLPDWEEAILTEPAGTNLEAWAMM